jgi:hypothetical protein
VSIPEEEAMKKRFFALFAVPVLAVAFALSSPATDEAQAYWGIECDIAAGLAARADYYGDEASAAEIRDIAERGGCNPWYLI